MALFLQQVVNGLGQGAIIVMFAVGFSLVFSKLGILNVAHGTFATWGAMLSYYAYTGLHVSIWLCMLLGALGAGVIGIVVDTVCFAPLRGRSSGLFGALITSIGAWTASLAIAQLIIGPNANGFPPAAAPSTALHVGGITILPMVIINVATAIVVSSAIWLLVNRTRFGAALRAIGHDSRSVAIAGVNTRIVIVWTACLAAGAAGLAGALSGLTDNVITFNGGDSLLIVGFSAVVIGGFGNIGGAVFGGFALGVIEVLSAQYISSNFQDAITFALLLAVLLVRPQGLFSQREVLRA